MGEEIVTVDDVVAKCDAFIADPWRSSTCSVSCARLRDLEPAPAEPPA